MFERHSMQRANDKASRGRVSHCGGAPDFSRPNPASHELSIQLVLGASPPEEDQVSSSIHMRMLRPTFIFTLSLAPASNTARNGLRRSARTSAFCSPARVSRFLDSLLANLLRPLDRGHQELRRLWRGAGHPDDTAFACKPGSLECAWRDEI